MIGCEWGLVVCYSFIFGEHVFWGHFKLGKSKFGRGEGGGWEGASAAAARQLVEEGGCMTARRLGYDTDRLQTDYRQTTDKWTPWPG